MSIHFNHAFKTLLFTLIKLYYFHKTCFICVVFPKKKKPKQYFEGRKGKKG
jgi:hypothetical protein